MLRSCDSADCFIEALNPVLLSEPREASDTCSTPLSNDVPEKSHRARLDNETADKHSSSSQFEADRHRPRSAHERGCRTYWGT